MSDENDTSQRPQFKVTDRRLFDREGNLRSDVAEPEPEAATPEAEPATTPPEPPAAAAPPEPTPAEPEPAHEEPAAPSGPPGARSSPADLPRDFAGFVESQYFETLLYLGAMPHPATGQVIEDLDMAQYKIDLITMLQEKTEGNRSAEESKLLDDVLYQLRMAFLQKSKVVKL